MSNLNGNPVGLHLAFVFVLFSLKTETEFGCLGREIGCRWPGEMGLLVKG